ncbi:hypothetical protein AGMMS50212_16210 [Spirochaetia bacterium]|nr:hypothetical protein AGMMS50212_16210 [Spirochaetia bacterium]
MDCKYSFTKKTGVIGTGSGSKRMKRFLLLLSFFIFYTNLYAQDQQQLETVRLRWQAVDYALQYEIIVEQQTDENTFVKVLDDIKRD